MGRLQDLSQRKANLAVVLLGVVLVLPSLWGGLHWDDVPMGQNLTRWLAGAPEQSWWDLFSLDAPDPRRRFGGRVPWWSVDHLLARFFRPVAAATHLLDYTLWPANPMAMHAHSIAWFAAMLAAALRLYRTVLSERLAPIAGALYAASYVHAIPVGWISNRNAVIAATFGFLAAAAYVRWRRTGKRGSWAPVLLLSSLLSSEGGVATLAFVGAFELTEGRKLGQGRWWKPSVMLLLLIAWRIGYSWGGFGAVGSGGYIDPIRSPWIFIQEAPVRLLWLIGFLMSPFRLLFAHGFPVAAAAVLGLIFLLATILVLRETLRPEQRLWAFAVALCLLPTLAAAPGERLLTFATAAICPIIASSLVRYTPSQKLGRAATFSLVLTYCVASPAVLLLGSYDQSYDLRTVSRSLPTMASISTEDLRGRNLFILNSPDNATVHIMRSAREKAGLGPPAFTWNLFPAESPSTTRRVGCCTLEISNSNGLSRGPFVVYFRGPDSPMQVGDTVETIAFSAEVLGVTRQGIPTSVRFTLKEPLESFRNVFVTWNGEDFERVSAETL